MHVEDLFEVLRTLWVSTEMAFDHERHRVQLSLIMLLAGITGSRPGALLALRYRDVQVTLIQDPAGGQRPIVLIELTYQYTKGYLGAKDSNTFPIPEIRHDPCLVLSPHAYFLALAFSDRAFAAQDLVGPEALFRLRVVDGLMEARIPWKKDVLDLHVFRKSHQTVYGTRISTQSLPDSTVRPWLRRLGEITGMKKICHPYVLRYAAGKAFDSCTFALDEISDSLRNLIMQHSKSDVFQRHYLPRYISADTQAAYRGMAAQSAVMRAASGMRRSIDPRRPRNLTTKQSASIENHPKVTALGEKRDKVSQELARAKLSKVSPAVLSSLRSARHDAVLAYQREKRRQRQALLSKLKKDFDRDQAIADIQDQLHNRPVDALRQTSGGHLPLTRARVYETLFTISEPTYKEDKRRMMRAITALSTLCGVEESNAQDTPACPTYRLGQRSKDTATDTIGPLNKTSGSHTLCCKPTQCFLCLGDRELLIGKRVKEFYSRRDLKKHLHRHHLKCIPEKSIIVLSFGATHPGAQHILACIGRGIKMEESLVL
ncbi:hypothetical protein B0J12DRAFT_610384 [Macrophomina phaseolina]|uniref:Tyr recombinase domain-containing protein n=1 Tax=Macrophomina phaseolina TaxID=35725 RepID=A0ABQ8FVQ1_9PEZI|nr:hypothetical protein B0J12DRAFT_610384 [Macrophomina phaseolina]